MYKQTLLKIIEPIKKTTLSRLNKGRKWKYGYDKDHDIVVLSRNGVIGEIYDIQGFKIALPKPVNVFDHKEKTSGTIILTKSLGGERRVFGLTITEHRPT